MLRLWVAIGVCSVETSSTVHSVAAKPDVRFMCLPDVGDDSSKAVGCACVVPTGMCLSVDLDPSGRADDDDNPHENSDVA